VSDSRTAGWFAEQVCEARNQWARLHERDWLEDHGEQVHPDDFIGKWIFDRLDQANEPIPYETTARGRELLEGEK